MSAVDVSKCAPCRSRRRRIAAITQVETIARILEPTRVESARRTPPQLERSW